MTNDPMQESVYETERQVWRGDMYRNDFATADSIAQLMASVMESASVSAVAPNGVKRLKPIVNSAFSETHPGVFVSDVMCGDRKFFLQLPQYTDTSEFKCTPNMVGLKFPEHGRNAPIISHELAHLLRFLELGLSKYHQEADHGDEFQGTYLAAVDAIVGPAESDLLRSALSLIVPA
jgi:hypothetical protein